MNDDSSAGRFELSDAARAFRPSNTISFSVDSRQYTGSDSIDSRHNSTLLGIRFDVTCDLVLPISQTLIPGFDEHVGISRLA
jgi:hypothetical protein